MNEGTPQQGTPIDARLPQPVTITWPEKISSVFKRVNIEFGGNLATQTTGNVVWAVQGDAASATGDQYRWKLRGGMLVAVVTNDCAGSGTDILFLSDNTDSCILPLGILDLAAPNGSEITDGVFTFDLGAGMLSRADGNKLLVSSNGDIGAGKIRVTGVVWGEEVPR